MEQQNLMQVITQSSPAQMVSNPQIANRFKELYKTIHGIKNNELAEAFYSAEQFHFLKIINDNPNIAQCTRLSLYGIFMDVAVSGLSFDPSMKHLYIVPFNTNVGTKDAPKWEKRAALQISGYGELLLRQLQGQIKHADNPVLVYEGDEFQFGTRDSKTILNHIASIPRLTNNIIAAYVKITRHDDTSDYKVMSMEEIQNLKKFSKDPNSKAWTDGLSGMVTSKVIKHAFKNYPKLRLGELTKLQTEVIDQEVQHVAIDYGLPVISDAVQYSPTMIVSPPSEQSPQNIQSTPTQAEELDF
mgnify:CR=1 FL=1